MLRQFAGPSSAVLSQLVATAKDLVHVGEDVTHTHRLRGHFRVFDGSWREQGGEQTN